MPRQHLAVEDGVGGCGPGPRHRAAHLDGLVEREGAFLKWVRIRSADEHCFGGHFALAAHYHVIDGGGWVCGHILHPDPTYYYHRLELINLIRANQESCNDISLTC